MKGIPKGYKAIEYRIPVAGDYYLDHSGNVCHCKAASEVGNLYVILEREIIWPDWIGNGWLLRTDRLWLGLTKPVKDTCGNLCFRDLSLDISSVIAMCKVEPLPEEVYLAPSQTVWEIKR